VKAAMSMMGLITDALRQPLLPLEEPHRTRLQLILEHAGLLDSRKASPAVGSAGSRSRTATAAHA
jgi:ABC-type thiamine transport system ATPase subunit